MVQNLDYGLNFGLDFGLNFGLHGQQNLQTNLAVPGLPAVQYLIASSLVSKVKIIHILMHFFSIDVSV